MALKVAMVEINGESRVPPETMRLLVEFAGHRDLCEQCLEAIKSGTGHYCVIGAGLFMALLEQDGVTFEPEDQP